MRRLLVANRGEIARRVIRAARGLGIEAVAVYSTGDAEAPFVAEADAAVALGGRSATESYLDVAGLLEAARRTGCDAVHPGYGFLAENAAFARAVGAAGLVFVGPSPEAIAALGDKLVAGRRMREAGVPVLSSREASEDLSGLELPLMVKAAAGGGGKGMRLVLERAGLEEAVASARREAAAAFGDDRVFLEPYLARARHVEVQIFGDSRGNLVHCFERECSIQRRHQKVIEEAPSPAVSPELRQELGEAALRAARALGYENAGTVEFLLDDAGHFYFLEVNTRIQVEHPVTEEVTGLDLVREQLLVASGEALSFSQGDLSLSGHAIEARLYAEDAANGFLPVTGAVSIWRPVELSGLRYESGIEQASVIGPEFDPLLAKVIARGESRREAACLLARGLEETLLAGLVTNRDFLVSVLRDEAFLAGDTTTAFIEERHPAARAEHEKGLVEQAAAVAALMAEERKRGETGVLASLPSGFRISHTAPERRRFRSPDCELLVEYRRERDGAYRLEVLGPQGESRQSFHVRRLRGSPSAPALEMDGIRRPVLVERAGQQVLVRIGGARTVELTELGRFTDSARQGKAGDLVAPMPGTVLSLHVGRGEVVSAGQLLAVVEAMKMEHRITAPSDGLIEEVFVSEGSQVSAGDLLVEVRPVGEA